MILSGYELEKGSPEQNNNSWEGGILMEKFEMPEVQVINLEAEDIITASCPFED